jgi:3-hydroxyacyl-CoA dehydrogenase
LGISSSVEDGAARLVIDNPPVNALSLSNGTVRALSAAVRDALSDPRVHFVTIEGASGRFCAGADIADFDSPACDFGEIRALMQMVEAAAKPIVAMIRGEAYGGGLELALAAHYRICTRDAKLGLPEIKLGLLPGSGGTQRLPRLVGMEKALEMMLTGTPVLAQEAKSCGLIDAVADDEAGMKARARCLADGGIRRLPEHPLPRAAASQIENGRVVFERQVERSPAARFIVDCLIATTERSLQDGLQIEMELFETVRRSSESFALRHAFFSERAVARIARAADEISPEIGTVGIVGAGTMGVGITLAMLAAGFSVTLVEPRASVRDSARERIHRVIDADLTKGRIDVDIATLRKERLAVAERPNALGSADLVVEAVFEDMAVKREVLSAIEQIVDCECILASNTSTLNLDSLAEALQRPERLVGMHFFSPAHIMRLVEVVRGRNTSRPVLHGAMRLVKRLGKVGVVSGVCDGFIGNRMFEEYLRQAYFLLEEGALPHQIDRALEAWGMAMGPFRTMDLAGQDVGFSIRQRRTLEQPDRPYSKIPDLIVGLGRLGQKNGSRLLRLS